MIFPGIVCAEVVFWLYVRLCVVPSFQPEKVPPKMTKAERLQLWERCLKWVGTSPQKFASGWFFDVDFDRITRDDCDRWMAWGLWGLRLEHLSEEVRIRTSDDKNAREAFGRNTIFSRLRESFF